MMRRRVVCSEIAVWVLATATAMAAWAQDAALKVAEPKESKAAVARTTEPARWSWGQPVADVTPTGDLKWAPQPFKFEAGKSVRYIDFAAGSDDNDGASKEKPWKHHPWDPAATGQAKAASGAQTYVFKSGVVYRGTLKPAQAPAGAADDPIRLTCDPAWGQGEAVLDGAEPVTGWKQGADNKDIPDAAQVWYVDLPYSPRNLWEVTDKGPERVPLARTPNWKESDPEDVHSEWFRFEAPEWWTGKNVTDIQGHKAHVGIDTKNLTQPADYYVGAIVRPEYGIVMGTPFPTRVEGFDAQKKAIIFQGIWFNDSEKIITNCRYFLEDKPQYLDSPGEFWFDRKPDGSGRLYARLTGDRDPNSAQVEAGRQIALVEVPGMSHVAITGLTFRFTNTHWDLTLAGWGHADVANAAIRSLGPTDDVRIANCKFEQIAGKALRIDGMGKGAVDHILVADNDIRYTDQGAMIIKVEGPGDVRVLRNNLQNIGMRPHRQDHGHAVEINFPATMELAGNVLTHCYGAGIFVFGGKNGGDPRPVPLSRVLVHHNRAVETLLQANDWGGIETWQGGPQYVYDNISGDPNGRWWKYDPKAPGSARLGFAYYHDGGFKIYNFNNVAWGNPVEATSPLRCQAAYYQAVPTIQNLFFNNTAYAFHVGTNWSPVGGRNMALGNLWMDISDTVFQYGQLKEDKGPVPADYEHFSTAISRNVVAQFTGPTFGVFEASGKGYADLASMQAAMQARQTLASDIGVMAPDLPVKNAKEHDFRPVPGSVAVGKGVKVFVPWAVARTVGEWNFRRNNADPAVLLDDHWNMAAYIGGRDQYYKLPTYPLQGVGIAAKDYAAGPLEDWTDGALTLNGKDQYAVLAQSVLSRPVAYRTGGRNNQPGEQKTAQDADLETPDIYTTNLLIEAYLKTADSLAGSVVVSKMADAGYQLAVNQAGGLTLTLKASGQTAELADGAKINDGKWHHVVAEVDRAAATGAIYVDGVKTATGPLALPAGASLNNAADLTVGKGAAGKPFAGSLEFLRIARATLAESKTSIEELYDWEFDGPALRDFAGKKSAQGRAAGAFDVAE